MNQMDRAKNAAQIELERLETAANPAREVLKRLEQESARTRSLIDRMGEIVFRRIGINFRKEP